MSVNKFKSEDYLYLALSTNIPYYTTEQKYNVFRNLNILGLCERYDDLFKISWQPNEDKEKFKEVYEKYSKKQNPLTEKNNWSEERNVLQNLIDMGMIDNETTTMGLLLYNSFSLCNDYLNLYLINYQEEYKKIKSHVHLTNDEKDFVKSYEYTFNIKDYYSNLMKADLKEAIKEKYNSTKNIKQFEKDSNLKEQYLIYTSEKVAKQKALIELANSKKDMISHLTYNDINQILVYAHEKAINYANEIKNEELKVENKENIDKYNYKNEIDKDLYNC